MKNLDESYFEQIHDVAEGRLTPDGISAFFLATLVFLGVISGISIMALDYKWLVVEPFISTIAEVFGILLIAHLMIAVLFLFNKIAFKFQRLQAILLSIIGVKFSVETYLFVLALYEDDRAAVSILYSVLLLFVGGIVLTLLMTIRAFNRVKKGEFKEAGSGILGFKDSKGYIIIPVIFAVLVFAGTIARTTDAIAVGNVIIASFWAVLLQYSLAEALPEFFLLTYCKLRFPSFHVEHIKRVKRGKRKGARNR